MNESEIFAYRMAAEKVINMISIIDQTLEFFEEYKIKPDQEVKKVLSPLIIKLKTWNELKN